MQSCEYVTFISTLACTLSNCYSKEDLVVLAAALSQLSATLATIIELEERKELSEGNEPSERNSTIPAAPII